MQRIFFDNLKKEKQIYRFEKKMLLRSTFKNDSIYDDCFLFF